MSNRYRLPEKVKERQADELRQRFAAFSRRNGLTRNRQDNPRDMGTLRTPKSRPVPWGKLLAGTVLIAWVCVKLWGMLHR